MRRRAAPACVLAVMPSILLTAPPAAGARQTGKVARIGLVAWSPRALYDNRGWLPVFREKLQDLGWVEGKNLQIEYRCAEGKAERLKSIVDELARLRLDLIGAVALHRELPPSCGLRRQDPRRRQARRSARRAARQVPASHQCQGRGLTIPPALLLRANEVIR